METSNNETNSDETIGMFHGTTEVDVATETPSFDGQFLKQYTIDVGEVKVEDKETGEEMWMSKAKTDDYENVSDEMFSAIMGLIEKIQDGE